MTRFLFVQSEYENVGIEYLSANLKKNGHQVELTYFPFDIGAKEEDKVLNQKIKKYKPDVVAFSPFSAHFYWSVLKAQAIKKRHLNIFVLFGGVHVNSVPDEVMKEKVIDGIIIGEAEITIVDFANNFGKKKIGETPSLWYRKGKTIMKNKLSPLETDLDQFPPPDKDLFYDQYPRVIQKLPYTAIGSRGCPFACTYCSNNIYQRLYAGQKRLRYMSPELFVDEIAQNQKKYGFKRVEFVDDVLAINEDRLEVLMKEYKKKVGLPFSCFFHPQLVSVRVIKLLKMGGCDWMKLGLQSANEAYRHKYLNRHETNVQVKEVSRLCQKYGLEFSFDHIFNLPGETKAHLVEAVSFYNECRPTIINFGGLMYLPGADIIKHGLDVGDLNKADLPAIARGTHQLSQQHGTPWYMYKKEKEKINVSAFMLLFVLESLLPKKIIDWLVKIKFYDIPWDVPAIVMIPLKIISKIKAGQVFLYWAGLQARMINELQKRWGKIGYAN